MIVNNIDISKYNEDEIGWYYITRENSYGEQRSPYKPIGFSKKAQEELKKYKPRKNYVLKKTSEILREIEIIKLTEK